MLVRTVAGVDHAAIHHAGEQVRRPLGTVPDNDDVGTERLERLAGIAQCFALAQRRGLSGEIDNVGVEPHRRQLEADARAGGWLDEQVNHGASAQGRHLLDGALTDRLKGAGRVEDGVNLLGTQRLDAEQMFSDPVHSLGLIGCSETVSSSPVSVRET